MQQKIIQIGNSIGVIIPKSIAKNKFKPGDVVDVEINKPGKAPSITPEFLSWLEDFNKKYKKALTELAKK